MPGNKGSLSRELASSVIGTRPPHGNVHLSSGNWQDCSPEVDHPVAGGDNRGNDANDNYTIDLGKE